MSHFLHGCWSNHYRHGNLKAQDSRASVNAANINKNSRPKSDMRGIIWFQNLKLERNFSGGNGQKKKVYNTLIFLR